MPSKSSLDRTVEAYARTIVSRNVLVWRYGLSPNTQNRLKKLKYRVNEKEYQSRYQDYPAVVVSCSNSISSCDSWSDYAHSCKKNTYVDRLKLALLKLGNLGKKSSNGCKNAIGHCAENHAANRVLKKHGSTGCKQLVFSKAIRPRTGEIIPYCDNCKTIFML